MDLPCEIKLKDRSTATVRGLDIGDRDGFADFYESIPQESLRFYCPHPLNRESAVKFVEQACQGKFSALVLNCGKTGKIAGVCWAKLPGKNHDCAVLGICLLPEFRGLGAGRILLETLLDILAHNGIKRVRLTVQLANPGAVKLYWQCGFEVIEEHMRPELKNYGLAPEPEYLMEKNLKEATHETH